MQSRDVLEEILFNHERIDAILASTPLPKPVQLELIRERDDEPLGPEENAQLAKDAREFAAQMMDAQTGDLASQVSVGFKIAERICYFLAGLDLADLKLPDDLQAEGNLLYEEAKNFVDELEGV